jgi:hypothetical protein
MNQAPRPSLAAISENVLDALATATDDGSRATIDRAWNRLLDACSGRAVGQLGPTTVAL